MSATLLAGIAAGLWPFVAGDGPGAVGALARRPGWRLSYEGRDVTADLSPLVTAVTYTDAPHGEADELAIELEDAAGRWQGPWRPRKGDRLRAWIGWLGELALPCGTFEVDEVAHRGPPRLVAIKALATPVTAALRTRRTVAYESTTLADVVGTVARRHGLVLAGAIAPLRCERLTQQQESDLAFLTRIGTRYGYVVGVRDRSLTFAPRGALDGLIPVRAIREGECEYELTTRTRQVYRECVVRWDDPGTRRALSARVTAPGVRTGDTLRVRQRCESLEQARATARAALERANRGGATGRVTLEGDPRCVAGVVVALEGFGELAGRYSIERSHHRLGRREGYRTEIELVQPGVVEEPTGAAAATATVADGDGG